VKTIKILVILLLVYVGIVTIFESLLGYFQPAGQGTLVITTSDDDGQLNQRVLSRLNSNGSIYVAANHWPRDWYNQALANPNVQVAISRGEEPGAGVEEEALPYLAVPAVGEEHERLAEEFAHGMVFRILTGFPPRYFVRLDPL
jgi:hypothetical protein